MSNLIDHAKREFLAMGYKPIEQCEDDPNKWIQENILELLEVFANQGHSGSSAPYCADVFKRLALFESLAPLTGEDSEWGQPYGEDNTQQNIRCSHVFKINGIAYDINGYIFKEDTGSCFTGYYSSREISFPYTPENKYIEVISYEINKISKEREEGSGWWITEYPQAIKDERALLELKIKGENNG